MAREKLIHFTTPDWQSFIAFEKDGIQMVSIAGEGKDMKLEIMLEQYPELIKRIQKELKKK